MCRYGRFVVLDSKEKARAITCLSNKKQLQLAWSVYAVDHSGRLVPNGWNIPTPPQPELGLWWAQGYLDYEGGNSENTNVLLLLNPDYAKLGPYTKAAAIYKCPRDRSQVKIGKRVYPRVRTVSMNQYMAGIGQCGTENNRFGPQTDDEILNPSMRFVFIMRIRIASTSRISEFHKSAPRTPSMIPCSVARY